MSQREAITQLHNAEKPHKKFVKRLKAPKPTVLVPQTDTKSLRYEMIVTEMVHPELIAK